MEEQKKSKEIKLGVEPSKKSAGQQKLSYEELNQACMELSQQNQQMQQYIQNMHNRMQMVEAALESKRMDFLFKVVEVANAPVHTWDFSEEFVRACLQEIEEALTFKEEPQEDKER